MAKPDREDLIRDVIMLVGASFVGFEVNLAVVHAQGSIFNRSPVLWAIVALVLTVLIVYVRYRQVTIQVSRPIWLGHGTPYPGLQPFTEKRAGVFFGREHEINGLVSRLTNARSVDQRFVPLVGASGCGKSSLLAAGLKPHFVETPEWTVQGPVTPGSQPVDVLARLIARFPVESDDDRERFVRRLRMASGLPTGVELAGPNEVLAERLRRIRHDGTACRLLILDQLEEIMTLATPLERTVFFSHVKQMLDEDPGLRILVGVRSEFLTDLLGGNGAELFRNTYVLPALGEAGMKAAITEPAVRAGVVFQDGVVEQMLDDAKGGDALALLAYVLRELCPNEPNGHRVTKDAYRAVGGVDGALRRQADAALHRLTDRYTREAVLTTLLRFVTMEGPEPTRRRVERRELTPDAWVVIQEFVEARLLVTTGDVVDIAHEALLRQWAPLCDAIRHKEEAIRRRTNLEPHAREWEHNGRGDDYLLVGDRLREVQVWLDDPDFGGSPLVEEFVRESARHSAALDRETADLVAAHALRLLPNYPLLANALAHAAVAECSPTPHALYALRSALDAPLRRVHFRGRGDQSHPVNAMACTADGMLAVASATGGVWAWQVGTTTPARLDTGANAGRVQSVAWSADGRLAAAVEDGTVHVWRSGLGQRDRLVMRSGAAVAVAWSARCELACLSATGELRVWQPDLTTCIEASIDTDRGQAIAWSPDGQLAIGDGDGMIHLWRPGATPVAVDAGGGRVFSVAWSDQGLLAAGTTDGFVRVFTVDGTETQRLSGHGGRALSVAWSADGRLASGSDNGQIRVWPPNWATPFVLAGHSGSVWALAWAAGQLLSGGEDGIMLGWVPEPGDVIELRGEARALGVAWSPSGDLAWISGGTINVRSAVDRVVREYASGQTEYWSVNWSADGRLAAGTADGVIRIGRPGQGEPTSRQVYDVGVWAIGWSPTGLLATGANDGMVRVWQPRELDVGDERIAYSVGDAEVWYVAWSQEGRLAACSDQGTVWVFQPGGQAPPRELDAGNSPVWMVAWSRDGRLAAASGDGQARVWDVDGSSEPIRLSGHGGGAWSVAWSADDRLAVGSGDGVVRVWQLGTAAGPVELPRHDSGIWLVAWSHDDRLAASSEDGAVRITHLPRDDPASLLRRYDGRGFPELTPEERRQYRLLRPTN